VNEVKPRNGENMKSIVTSMIVAAGLMVAGSAMATDMPAVAKKNNCTACHAVDKKVVGPAWKAVADKYKGDAAAWDKVAAKVKKGGSGAWGSMPMPANPKVSDADMAEIIGFIKGL
jgi:cytochrome c